VTKPLFIRNLHRLGACLLGIILKDFSKNGIGAAVSAGMGFITLIIAHHLASRATTMEMMRAVAGQGISGFATHVVAVTTATRARSVAGFLALIYIVRGVFTKTLDEATANPLARMIMELSASRHCSVLSNGSWRHLGRPIMGTFFGDGIRKKNGALIMFCGTHSSCICAGAGNDRERASSCAPLVGIL